MEKIDRILIHHDTDKTKWFVWEAHTTILYNRPTDDAKSFGDRESATLYAYELAIKNNLTKYDTGVLGFEYLSKDEIILSLRRELDEYIKSPYCSQCGACGEDGCCSGSICKKNICLYGETYLKEYEYNKKLLDELYESFPDKEKLKKIFTSVYDKIYGVTK
jgi:hypothetical protein